MPIARDKSSTRQDERAGKLLEIRLATGVVPGHRSEAVIKLARTTAEEIAAQPAAAEGLLERWSNACRRADRTGKPVIMNVVVDPRQRNPAIKLRDAVPADALDDALKDARRRGATEIGRVLRSAEMASADAFAELIGATRQTVNQKRRRFELLGLEGPKRGYRFPIWQVDSEGKSLAGLPRLFEALGPHPWAVYRFLVQHHPELGGATGLDALRSKPLDEVISVAAATGTGSFT